MSRPTRHFRFAACGGHLRCRKWLPLVVVKKQVDPMARDEEYRTLVLPRDPVRRVLLGVVSLGWLPPSGFAWFMVTFPPQRPPGLFGQAFQIVASEFLITLFIVSAIGLIWAIATPRWVAMVADGMTKRLWLMFILALIAIGALATVF